MKRILLWVWQLPQHLLGLLLIWLLEARKKSAVWIYSGREIGFWEFEPKGRFSRSLSGASLGEYIILPPRSDYAQTVLHEYGHSLQSRRWGPLYLLAVGLPSAIGNLWDRLAHKKWPAEKRVKWYYSRWPEKQADRFGGITRAWEG